jgi:hypothetical protein
MAFVVHMHRMTVTVGRLDSGRDFSIDPAGDSLERVEQAMGEWHALPAQRDQPKLELAEILPPSTMFRASIAICSWRTTRSKGRLRCPVA